VQLVAKDLDHAYIWNRFAEGRKFKQFSLNFDYADVLNEFICIRNTRNEIYAADDSSKHYLSRDPILPYSVAAVEDKLQGFSYNFVAPFYNASHIAICDRSLIAMEGPQNEEGLIYFKQLLIEKKVQIIVRLTATKEGDIFKTTNYWQKNIYGDFRGRELLALSQGKESLKYFFSYYAVDDWQDHSAFDIAKLLGLVLHIRQENDPSHLIAVHCRAGVGRTGTFIAAMALIDIIEEQLESGVAKHQLNFSIEEIVYRLSLQRPYMVGNKHQYASLYELVALYIQSY